MGTEILQPTRQRSTPTRTFGRSRFKASFGDCLRSCDVAGLVFLQPACSHANAVESECLNANTTFPSRGYPKP